MTEVKGADSELGRELFRCRPRSLLGFSALRNQGALPAPKWLKCLQPAIALTSPVLDNVILAGLPTILAIFFLQDILGLKPPHEPVWSRTTCFAILATSILITIWWCWIAPRKDCVIVCERGVRWQVSLSCWKWFRSRGSLAYASLHSFSYRSDCFGTEPVEWKTATADKLDRIWLEVNLSQYDIALHLKDDKDVVIEDFFARFNQNDLGRFLDHLATVTSPHQITV